MASTSESAVDELHQKADQNILNSDVSLNAVATDVSTEPGCSQETLSRKLTSIHRQILLKMDKTATALEKCTSADEFSAIENAYFDLENEISQYYDSLGNVTDQKTLDNLNERITVSRDRLIQAFQITSGKYSLRDNTTDKLKSVVVDVNKQLALDKLSRSSIATTSSKREAKRIELDLKKAETIANAKLKKAAVEAEAQIEIDQRRIETQSKLKKAEADRDLAIELAQIDAEEKILLISDEGSNGSLRSSLQSRCKSVNGWKIDQLNLTPRIEPVQNIAGTMGGATQKFNKFMPQMATVDELLSHEPMTMAHTKKPILVNQPNHVPSQASNIQNEHDFRPVVNNTSYPINPMVQRKVNDFLPQNMTQMQYHQPNENSESNLLQRACQIKYNGANMPFVFYEAQIRDLMQRSSNMPLKLEIFRASCLGPARDIVTLLVPQYKGLNAEVRIEKAFARLRNRFGTNNGFLSEQKVDEIRFGNKLRELDATSLRDLIGELDLLELYALCHNEMSKLQGQLVIDLIERLPRRSKDDLCKTLRDRYDNPNEPTFEMLRNFLEDEQKLFSTQWRAKGALKASDDRRRDRRQGFQIKQATFDTNKPHTQQTKYVHKAQNNQTTETNQHEQYSKEPEKANYATRTLPICFLCAGQERHLATKCQKYMHLNPTQRRDAILNVGCCLNCYGKHSVNDCRSLSKCRICGPFPNKKHNFTLHELYLPESEHIRQKQGTPILNHATSAQPSSNLGPQSSETSASVRDTKTSLVPSCSVVLPRITAVRVKNPLTGQSVLAYAQHDPGSQITLISSRLQSELNLRAKKQSLLTLHTLTGSQTSKSDRVSFNIESLETGDKYFLDDAAVINTRWADEPFLLPHKQDLSDLPHFQGIRTHLLPERNRVDILIGLDNSELMMVLEERQGELPSQPHCILTPLGYLASGGRSNEIQSSNQNFKVNVCDQPDIQNVLKKEIADLKETINVLTLRDEDVEPSINDEKAHQMVEPNIKVIDGRYQVPVPIKPIAKALPNNHNMAADRAMSLRRTALRKPKLLETLVRAMSELQENGHILPLSPEAGSANQQWYLPYFLTSVDTKPRIVYDGAAVYKGVSINQTVLSGPDLLNPLMHVLARFRQGKYAFMGDLSKCFFQISIPPEQQDLFRILWFKNNDVANGELQTFRFCRHVWGINSSPYIACLAIRHLTEENPTNATQLTLDTIRNNMYVDDLIVSFNSLSDAETVISEAEELFKSRGFDLTKFSANQAAKSIISNFPKERLAPQIRSIDLENDALPTTKAIGCSWNAENDTLLIQGSLTWSQPASRREMLSQLSRQFDPIGFASPFMLKGRIILQNVAAANLGWDDPINPDIVKEWQEWFTTLKVLEDFSIPRQYFPDSEPPSKDDEVIYQLHGFSDASDLAYGSVIYLRRLVNGVARAAFVFGKSRVVLRAHALWPIARKELHAAKITVDLMKLAADALRHLKCTKHFWIDSSTVLQWIKNADLRLNKFVKRRINHILTFSASEEWQFCPTNENSADIATRPNAIKTKRGCELWLNGPSFLLESKTVPDIKNVTVRTTQVTDSESLLGSSNQEPLQRLIDAAPTLYSLQKRTAYWLAFADFIRAKKNKKQFEKPCINASYLDLALIKIIKFVQTHYFGAAVKMLQEHSPDYLDDAIKRLSANATDSQRRRLKELKSLRNLRPCCTPDNLLRIDGRLDNAPLAYESKHPVILPARHSLTRLIILDFHVSSAHSPPQYTLMGTRKKYWIVYGISTIKRYLHDCGACALEKAKPIRQLMSDLPPSRLISSHKPFSHCGCDYLGPFIFREGRSDRKAWGLLFTCMSTRAIHVELVTSLDLNSFILAFSRFTDLRGPVQTMYSDNGTTFKAAANKLPALLQSNDWQTSLRKKGIDWQFIPAYAPAQGGVWEAAVKLFKNALMHVADLAKRKPSLVELQTYCSNAIRIVNDRPLTPISDNPQDLDAISPSVLLNAYLDPKTPVGEPHEKGDLRHDYLYNVTLAQRFWDRWIKFYLPLLQGRKKWLKITENLAPGQLVLVGSANDISGKRGTYRIGRVHEVLPQTSKGRSLVRRAIIAVAGRNETTGEIQISYIERDLSKIAPV